MSLNLTSTIAKFLQNTPEQKFTPREIVEWVYKNYPDRYQEKQARSTATAIPLDNDKALLQQIAAEIGSQKPALQKKYPKIKTTEGRPRKYYFTESTDSTEVTRSEDSESDITSSSTIAITKEYQLYSILSEFLWSELGIYSKRIDEKRSSNQKSSKGNKWLYPDIVAIEDLSKNWHDEIKHCTREYSDKKTKLWSFEVKTLVNRSNVREVFFHTVSNSSWANFGYLVASEIQGSETLRELGILSSLHGIGFIRLDIENPSESQIIITAKEKTKIDWDTANRLAEENKDFLKYIKLIRQFYQTGDIRKSDWDLLS